MVVYFNGQYSELNDVKISPFERGFQYADGVYEVMRTYSGKFFRYEDHMQRLAYSLNEIKIKFNSLNEIDKILKKLIETNHQENDDIVAYIQITRGASFPRKHSFPPENVSPTVFITTSSLVKNAETINDGIKVILEKDIRWKRCDIKSVSLLPSVLANQHAVEESAGEAVWVNNGFLTEGSHTNFFGIRNGVLYTAPLSSLILAGVTRKVILEVCESLNIEINETAIKENELEGFDEFFISGTTTEIKPVVQIDNRVVSNGRPGEITKRIYEGFVKVTAS